MSGTRRTRKSPKGRSCRQKRSHPDRWTAEVARQVRIKRGAAEDRVSVYACRHCGGWHTGNTPAPRLQAGR